MLWHNGDLKTSLCNVADSISAYNFCFVVAVGAEPLTPSLGVHDSTASRRRSCLDFVLQNTKCNWVHTLTANRDRKKIKERSRVKSRVLEALHRPIAPSPSTHPLVQPPAHAASRSHRSLATSGAGGVPGDGGAKGGDASALSRGGRGGKRGRIRSLVEGL